MGEKTTHPCFRVPGLILLLLAPWFENGEVLIIGLVQGWVHVVLVLVYPRDAFVLSVPTQICEAHFSAFL